MDLNKSLHINTRKGSGRQLSLNGVWQCAWVPDAVKDIREIPWRCSAHLPQSAGWCLFEAGILPHPYEGTNSRQYRFIKDNIWYFRRTFTAEQKSAYAYLSFDGCAYYSRVWLNGELLGSHEGMFGGPVIEVAQRLRYGEENELLVECTPGNYGFAEEAFERKPSTFAQPGSLADTNVIAPWQLTNDFLTSGGDFSVVGIWRDVRIDFLDKYHLNNVYCYTKEAGRDEAVLRLEIPVTNPFMDETIGIPSDPNTWAAWAPFDVTSDRLTDLYTGEDLKVTVCLTAPDGEVVFRETLKVDEYDLTMTKRPVNSLDYTYLIREITLKNPVLWSPFAAGEAPLYRVELTLLHDGKAVDEYSFETGIRTVRAVESAGPRFHRRWGKFQLVVNGEKVFLKGMNFTEIDQMLRNTAGSYGWLLRLAKNAGVQLIRVWSGGSVPEADLFYDLCDRLGIMVWQDSLLANNTTRNWDTDVLRSQISYYLCRIRNHPSFVIHCGGNEFNPYSKYNAASMFAVQNESDVLIPDRIFYRATADSGDIHPYFDMEPNWYRHLFKKVPLLSESGIHSLPTAKTLRRMICGEEYNRPLDLIFSDEFPKAFPELRNHFSEFSADRIVRMLARASHMRNMKGISVKDLCEASQLAAYEFYQMMIECAEENYPVTTGIMPWVFQRPWPTAAIQLVDGLGNPCLQYYAVKRAYEPVHPFVGLQYLNFRPGEQVELPVRLFAQRPREAQGQVILEIYGPDMEKQLEKCFGAEALCAGVQTVAQMKYTLPDTWHEAYWFIRVRYLENGTAKGEALYTPKILNALSEEQAYLAERTWPCKNLYFEHGPWLMDQLKANRGTDLSCRTVGDKLIDGRRTQWTVEIENRGSKPIYPVVIETADDGARCCCSDNVLWLNGGEKRVVQVSVECDQAQGDGVRVDVL